MKKILGASIILTGALLSGGCATKKYVQQTAAPIQTKVDQVADQTNKQGTEIDAAKKDLERHETGINAAKERAMSAENRANEAMTAANKADQDAMQAQNMSTQNTQSINSLTTALGNLDDYKLQAETVVPFGFNHDELTSEAKEQLDQFVGQHTGAKRYFITIEGYTDKTGTKSYNDALSRRRAEHVMAYLITQHNIPVFRVQDIGLGNEKPADTGRNRAARAKNRRVEVRMFTADTNLAMAQPTNGPVSASKVNR
ncbi:MAG TPA: OmpA family protein [Bryobacteraceae bacterium]|nr:OmpA family protein [Bryobacteraceae bacterium]